MIVSSFAILLWIKWLPSDGKNANDVVWKSENDKYTSKVSILLYNKFLSIMVLSVKLRY